LLKKKNQEISHFSIFCAILELERRFREAAALGEKMFARTRGGKWVGSPFPSGASYPWRGHLHPPPDQPEVKTAASTFPLNDHQKQINEEYYQSRHWTAILFKLTSN